MAVDTQVVGAEQLIVKHLDLWTSAQTAKSTAGRGSNNKIELTGIKKLRELILELAVRGKLVPQDPNDEPTSELLKRIDAKKIELYKAGLIKKQNTIPPVSEGDKPFEIPSSWCWVRLAEIGQIYGGGTPSSSDPDMWADSGVKWLTPADLYGNKGKFIRQGKRDISLKGLQSSSARILPAGAVLFSSRAPIGYVAIAENELCTNQGFKSVVPYITEFSTYLYWFLKRSAAEIDHMASGTTFKEISGSEMSKVCVPLPPVKHQELVCSKIETLMGLVDQLEKQSYQSIDAHKQLVDTLLQTLVDSANADELASNWQRLSEHFDTLFSTEYSIDALKQTILQLAVMGKLVKQDPTDEPASELLKRIAKEKEALVKAGKIKKQKPLPPITDDEKPFELPKGWEWCRLAEISSIKGGFAYKSTEFINTGDAQVIRMGNVRPDYFRLDENPVYIDGKYAQLTKDYEVLEGEIVITMTGTKGKRDYLYSVLVEPDDVRQRPLFLNQRLCSARPVIVVSELLSLVMKDSRLLDMIYAKSTGSANQANIGMEAISNWLIPLPPLNEQNKIIAKFMMLNDICSKLTNRLDKIRSIHYLLADTLVEQVII